MANQWYFDLQASPQLLTDMAAEEILSGAALSHARSLGGTRHLVTAIVVCDVRWPTDHMPLNTFQLAAKGDFPDIQLLLRPLSYRVRVRGECEAPAVTDASLQ